ncbi:MAG: hypothetical protein A3K19_02780 [Lentisphaerae bacterium RIFOXYB12_FULL_65_16]|nr:MAG: hypothetical protein A3K18_19830 [Lentisphaerae bacterium RIFOXYA12_64_32]OGV92277.1 MAG: hypothetical protein A3K19_02780 [Lentisphaerae bacterium RIFOXYB12_FULL_65_16]
MIARECLLVLLGACLCVAGLADDGGLAARCDLAQCVLVTPGQAEVTADGDAVCFAVRPAQAEVTVRLVLREPLALTGKERLVLEARGEEWSKQSLCMSRVRLLAADMTEALYEPDLGITPEWNRRTVMLHDFSGPLPAETRTIEFGLWNPGDVGREFRLYLRRIAFLTPEEVFAELQVPQRPPRPRLTVRKSELTAADRRWVSFDPGGGGWYRTVAFSPHDGSCWLGGDVGGVYRTRDNGQTWEVLNQGLRNLYCNTIAFHPRDPLVVFAGTNGGVAKSTDGGLTWALRRVGFPPRLSFGQSAPVSAIAVHPARPEIVLAGIGHEREFGRLSGATVGGRVYRSTDGGETWRLIELPGDADVRKLSVFCFRFDPADPNRVFLSTQAGLFTSADAGETWASLGQPGLVGYLTTFLTVKADAPSVMLLAYTDGPAKRGGVLKSTDAGVTWAPVNEGLPARTGVWRLVAHPRDPNVYFLGYHSGGGGLYVTRDAGATWQPLNRSANLRTAWFFYGENVTGLDIDPRNPDRLVYCNDMDIYQTLDAGKMWDQIATTLVSPATPDRPAVWRGRNCPILCAGGPQALAVDPTNPATLYFGYWDTHAWKSDDGGASCWRLTNGIDNAYGRMGSVVLDPDDPDIVYLSKGENYDRQRLFMSVDAGRQFHLIGHAGNGLPEGGIFTLLIDPRSPRERRTLYAGEITGGVYKSDDGGRSWHAQSEGLPENSRAVKQIVMDPADPKCLFLAAGAHYRADTKKREKGYLARTLDGGAHWEVVKTNCEAQCILLDPFDSQTVYAGNRNYSGIDYPQAFYKSTDGGATWKSLAQDAFLAGPGTGSDLDNGPRVYVTCLAADPTERGLIYAACAEECYDGSNGRGVFVSRDSGETWTPMPAAGLYNFNVGALVVDPVDPARLYVGTGGNGFFRFGPAPQPASGEGAVRPGQ